MMWPSDFRDPRTLIGGQRLVYCKHGARAPGDLLHQKDRQMLVAYQSVLGRRSPPRSVMEIGICEGGSLAMWRTMWPKSRIVGVDMTFEHIAEGTRSWLAAQNVETHLFKMPSLEARQLGVFDLLIDDGGHGADTVLSTFQVCWTMVAPGGVYIVEDWHLKEFDPARVASELGLLVIGQDNGEHWCDGEFPPESALRVEIYRRLIAVFKR
jgi:hypothetical protein